MHIFEKIDKVRWGVLFHLRGCVRTPNWLHHNFVQPSSPHEFKWFVSHTQAVHRHTTLNLLLPKYSPEVSPRLHSTTRKFFGLVIQTKRSVYPGWKAVLKCILAPLECLYHLYGVLIHVLCSQDYWIYLLFSDLWYRFTSVWFAFQSREWTHLLRMCLHSLKTLMHTDERDSCAKTIGDGAITYKTVPGHVILNHFIRIYPLVLTAPLVRFIPNFSWHRHTIIMILSVTPCCTQTDILSF